MPAAKGKQSITIVVPDGVKETWDAEASARGIDRSSLILAKIQAVDGQGPWDRVASRLDHQDRQLATIQESLTQLVTALHELVASLQKAPTVAQAQVYPTPATYEEVYGAELKALREAATPVVTTPVEAPGPAKKGWARWRP